MLLKGEFTGLCGRLYTALTCSYSVSYCEGYIDPYSAELIATTLRSMSNV